MLAGPEVITMNSALLATDSGACPLLFMTRMKPLLIYSIKTILNLSAGRRIEGS